MLDHSAPGESLQRELQEVAQDAKSLLEYLHNANNLPPTFPKEQLAEIAASLARLPNGTAEGCRTPLEYARNRLPYIRREHILTASLYIPNPPDSLPPILRGDFLDQKVRDLIASVTTALDEYRRLASEEGQDDIEPAASVAPQEDVPIQAVIDQAVSVESAAGEAREIIAGLTRPESKGADQLRRQLWDVAGLNRLARAELKMPKIVADWIRKIADALRNYPDLIRRTASTLRVGADILEIGLHRWGSFWMDFEKFAIEQFKAVCESFDEVADKLDQHRPKSGDKASKPPEDFDLREVKRLILIGKPPPVTWRPFVFSLSFHDTDLHNLEPLAGLVNLRSLNLHGTHVVALSPISGLANLEALIASGTKVTNLEPLAKLTNLKDLSLEGAPLKSIVALAGLTSLQSLNLGGTRIENLTAIKGLTNLAVLQLSGTRIGSLTPLANLEKLYRLYLSDTAIRDLTPLSKLENLQRLDLARTPVTEVRALTKLRELRRLDLSNTRINDVSALAFLTKLEVLDINNTDVSDISRLAGLQNLRSLNVTSTFVTDLTALDQIRDLSIETGGKRFTTANTKREHK